MVKIKEGFKGERLVSLPEELLTSYQREPLINNLYVRKIGFFPRVKYHFLQKEHGCDYAMLIYCTEGKGWYRILGKQYTVEKYQYIIIRSLFRRMNIPVYKIGYGCLRRYIAVSPWDILKNI